jgi:hypothetical protein
MKFLLPADARASCQRLDTDATMRIAEYGGLVAETAYPEIHRVECQLIREDGRVCHTKFGNGWIASRKDGVQVYIGGDCAGRHFSAGGEEGKRYRADATAMARSNRISALRQRIETRKSDADYLAALRSSYERCETLRDQAVAERDGLPERVVRRLHDIRRGISRDVPGEVRYVEKDEDREGKVFDVVRWRPASLGTLMGVEGLDTGTISSIQETVRSAHNALRETAADEKRLEKALTNQINKLDAAATLPARLDSIERSLEMFRRPENYRALCWIAIRDDDREAVVARMLERQHQPAKLQHARAKIAEWRREIESAHGGRLFRAIQ